MFHDIVWFIFPVKSKWNIIHGHTKLSTCSIPSQHFSPVGIITFSICDTTTRRTEVLVCQPPMPATPNRHSFMCPYLSIRVCDKISQASRTEFIDIKLWHTPHPFSYEPIVRSFSAFNGVSHPVQHHNTNCRKPNPHSQELWTYLSHDVSGHGGVVPHIHAKPDVDNEPGDKLYRCDGEPADGGLYR